MSAGPSAPSVLSRPATNLATRFGFPDSPAEKNEFIYIGLKGKGGGCNSFFLGGYFFPLFSFFPICLHPKYPEKRFLFLKTTKIIVKNSFYYQKMNTNKNPKK